MYNHKLHRGREHFCHCCLAFSLAKILESNVLDCFKISGKQIIRMHKKGKYVRLKNYEKKIKSPFMMYAVFESILVSEYIIGSQIGSSFIQTNIKSILLAVMVINQYVFKIKLVSLLSYFQAEMLFTILLTVWSKKENAVVI